MGETPFQHLSVEERRLALGRAQAEGPHPAFLFEQDVWVVATLNTLFEAPCGIVAHIVRTQVEAGLRLFGPLRAATCPDGAVGGVPARPVSPWSA